MNKINHENYEAYVLDYLEGRLSKEDRDTLKKFLLLHPELNIDLEMDLPVIENDAVVYTEKESMKRDFTGIDVEILEYLENIMPEQQRLNFENKLKKDPLLVSELKAYKRTILPVEHELIFEFKNNLYKQNEAILSNKAINYLEGNLNKEEAVTFERELALNTDLAYELALFKKTKLSADTSVSFENKSSLKKEALVIPFYRARVVFSIAAAVFFIICLSFLLNYYLRPSEPARNSTFLSMDSKKDKTSSPDLEIPLAEPNHKPSPITKEKLAFKKYKNIKTIASNTHLTNTNDVLAQNKTPHDSASVSNTTSDSNAALTIENGTKPLSEAEIEGLQKLEYAYMIPFEEEEENETFDDKNKKTSRSFWNFATRLAKKANQLGIKSINGNEDENNHYLLTFNAVTIEKK